MLANFTINDPLAIAEGNEGTANLRFTVTLAEPNGSEVAVNYQTAPETALSGGADTDFVAKSGMLTFPVGVTTQFIDVTINGDMKVELDETFTVTLSGATGGTTISVASGTGTINNDDSAQVKIGHLLPLEGNANHDVDFIITLSNPVDTTVTVNYATVARTASDTGPERDYIPETGVITFSPGDTLERVGITIVGDTRPEPDEIFELHLSDIQAASRDVTFENTVGMATIFNDASDGTPPAPTLSINDVAVNEGHSGTKTVQFTVTLENFPGTAPAVIVNYTTQDGSATAADNDYEPSTGTLTFFPGDTTRTIDVTINGDTKVEAGIETFDVVLANASLGVTIVDGTGTATISDDDAAEITISDVTQAEGNSGQSTFSFRVALSNPVDVAVSGNFATQPGTAEDQTGNNDFMSNSGTFAFAPGVTETFVLVDVNGDTASEPNETFSVVLSGLQTGGRNVTLAGDTALGTITNDDDGLLVALSINDVTQAESNPNYVFTLSLSAPVATQVCVDVTTEQGTSNVCIPAQTTSVPFTVNIPDDNIVELDNTFQVTLSNVTGATNVTIGDGTGIGTTQDDDTSTISIDDASVDEGNSGDTSLPFIVTLSNPVAADVVITFSTASGSATDQTGDNDYQSQSSAIVIPAMQLTGTINVAVHGDNKVERDESLTVTLGQLTAGGLEGDAVQIVDSLGLGLITNDDQATLSINDVEQSESLEDYEFTITLSQPVDTAITVDVMTDLDTTPITFAAGETTQTIVVNVPDNDIVEFDGEFTVTLANLQPNNRNVVIGDGMGVGTILDDDTATISINDVEQLESMEDYVFTISLSGQVDTLVCVDVMTDLDMTTVCFDPLEISTTFTVNVPDNDIVEFDGFFEVMLSNVDAGGLPVTLMDAVGEGTILDDDTADMTIGDATIVEGNNGQSMLMFTVTLTQQVDATVTVDFATSDGTAQTSDNDYGATTGTLTFAPLATTQTISVPIVGDLRTEADETFTVTLSNLLAEGLEGVAVAITDATATGTITNDDVGPTLAISDAAIAEGNAGTTNLVFNVTLINANPEATVTVNVSTADGSATTADNDFTAITSQPITFGPGQTSQQVIVAVNGDNLVEADETLTVTLSDATGATIGDATGGGTITNDDAATISIGDSSNAEGHTGSVGFPFTVTLSNPVDVPVTVTVNTADGSATIANNDYAAVTNATVTIPAGVLSGTVSVDVIGDIMPESDETFDVVLSNLQAAGRTVTIGDQTGTGTIENDDIEQPILVIGDATIAEGNSGTTMLVFTVTLMFPEGAVTVNYATQDGTATIADNDYASSTGSLTLSPTSPTATVQVPINGDLTVEANETLQVVLSSPDGAVIGDGTATGTITNDDAAAISITDAQRAEGDSGTDVLSLTVSLSNPVDVPVTVMVNTSNDTATAGSDYVAVSGQTITFTPGGPLTQSVSVTVNGDMTVELNETFNVTLSGLAAGDRGVTLADATGVGTITNDDNATITINDVMQAESIEDYTFTITLSRPVDVAVTLDAMTDLDTTPITFAPGETTQTLMVNVPDNNIVEFDGEFFVNLANLQASGRAVTIADAQGMGTILDDDTATLSINDVMQEESMEDYVFTITLSNPVDAQVCVDVDTDLDMATVCFAALDTSETFTVNFPDNDIVEPDGFFEVMLSNVTAQELPVTIADAVGEGTILDDDTATLSIDNVSVMEGNSGEVPMNFTLTLSNPVDATVTVDFAIVEGTAEDEFGDNDFHSMTGTVTFAPMQTTATIMADAHGDTRIEPNETFFVQLSNIVADDVNPGSVVLSTTAGTGTGTILNDDSPTISIADASIVEGNSGTTNLQFTITLSAAAANDVTFDVATANGTATSTDNDFTAVATTPLTIAAGQTSQTFDVSITGDTKVEANENFTLTIANAVGATILDGTVTGTITNDDAATIAIADASVAEGATGNTPMTFNVTLSNAVDRPVTVTVNMQNGTATTADNDYTVVTNGTVTIPAGQTTATVTVNATGDNRVEPNETFTVTLTNPLVDGAADASVTLGDATATGTINNDDTATISIVDASVTEGNTGNAAMTFNVTLSNPVDRAVTVTVNTQDGTATVADSDYTAVTNGTVTIPAGQTTATVTVNASGDTRVEANETITVTLTNPLVAGVADAAVTLGDAAVTLGDATATGTINNDDVAQLSIADVTLAEGTGATPTAFTFTITSSAAASQPITVQVSTADGTATTADSDYTAISNQTVTIPAGQTSATVTVNVTADSNIESNETFTVTLANAQFGGATDATRVTISDANATGTINNDDFAATSSLSGAVFVDANANGVRDASEPGIPGVTITLTGTDSSNAAVNRTLMTGNDGSYTFGQLSPGTYTITETQSPAFMDGTETAGTAGGTVGNDAISAINLLGDTSATGYLFSERGLLPQFVSKRLFLSSTPDTQDMLRELNARSEELAGNQARADAIRAGGEDSTGAARTISIADAAITEGNSGTSTLSFNVTMSSAFDVPVTVTVNTADGSAVSGQDYVASANQTVTLNPGETSRTVTVTINGDTTVEANETFTVNLSNLQASGGNVTLSDASATGTINNNDSASFSINDASLNEGNTGSTNFPFTVTMTGTVDLPVTVTVNTGGGTATAGTDYTAITNQTLTFSPGGAATQTVNVSVQGDTTDEPNETFNVTLSNVQAGGRPNVTLSDATGVGTITNDDGAASTLSIADATVNEPNNGNSANLTFTVTASPAATGPVIFNFSTANGTALTTDNDFTGVTSQQVTIPAGTATQSVTVSVVGDNKVENDETLTVNLTNASGATIGDGTANGTIIDNDSATLSINDRSDTEGDVGSHDGFPFTITLSNAVDTPVTVTVDTADATATLANNDYDAVTGMAVTIPAGALSGMVSVDVVGDTAVEQDETFDVVLSNLQVASGRDVTILDGTGVGTIEDDDQSQAGALVQSINAQGNVTTIVSAEISTSLDMLHATHSASDAHDAVFSGWDGGDSTGALDRALSSWLP